MNSKWRNHGLYASLLALVGLALNDILGAKGIPFVPEKYDLYVEIVLYLLAGAGVISNPESGKGYRDIKKDLFK